MFVRSRISSGLYLLSFTCAFICVTDKLTWTEATDYCSLCHRAHTMCRYPSSNPSKNCDKYENEPLTSSEIKSLVDKHNELRMKVAEGRETRGSPGPQPPASDMKLVSWDEELATIAQRWGDQCAPKPHDDCREVERFQVGQNVATTWSSAKITDPIEKLVDGWYNEVKLFSCADVSRYRSRHATGHYTQLVWAKTSSIGCGKVKFWDRKRRMNTMRLICNYGPAGNFLGHPMYTVAEGGPRCSSGVSKVHANIVTCYDLFATAILVAIHISSS